jgi:hypothetical protein
MTTSRKHETEKEIAQHLDNAQCRCIQLPGCNHRGYFPSCRRLAKRVVICAEYAPYIPPARIPVCVPCSIVGLRDGQYKDPSTVKVEKKTKLTKSQHEMFDEIIAGAYAEMDDEPWVQAKKNLTDFLVALEEVKKEVTRLRDHEVDKVVEGETCLVCGDPEHK